MYEGVKRKPHRMVKHSKQFVDCYWRNFLFYSTTKGLSQIKKYCYLKDEKYYKYQKNSKAFFFPNK